MYGNENIIRMTIFAQTGKKSVTMSKKTFYMLFIIAEIIFYAGVVLCGIDMFGHNHPTAAYLGVRILCFGALCKLLVILFKNKQDKDHSEKTNS